MDIWILLRNQVHSRLQTSFLSLSSETPGSAPALCSKPDAGSTEDMQQSQDLRGFGKCGWHSGRQDKTHVVFCPCTIRQSGWIRQVIEISAAKDINSHENNFLVYFFKKYFNFHTWNSQDGRLTEMVYPWMERVNLKWIVHFFSWQTKGHLPELQTAASREEFLQGWCQALAKEWYVSCKTMSLIPKAAFTFQHIKCHRLIGPQLQDKSCGADEEGECLAAIM